MLLSFGLTFSQFQPGVAYKSIAYKKKRAYQSDAILFLYTSDFSKVVTLLKTTYFTVLVPVITVFDYFYNVLENLQQEYISSSSI